MWQAILGIADKLLSFMQMIAVALKKTPTQVIEEDKAKIKEKMDKFKETGRPQ